MLNNILLTYTKGDWSKGVAGAQLVYNTKVCEATNERPYKLFFGREAKLPLGIIVGLPEEEVCTVPEYIKEITRGTEEIRGLDSKTRLLYCVTGTSMMVILMKLQYQVPWYGGTVLRGSQDTPRS